MPMIVNPSLAMLQPSDSKSLSQPDRPGGPGRRLPGRRRLQRAGRALRRVAHIHVDRVGKYYRKQGRAGGNNIVSSLGTKCIKMYFYLFYTSTYKIRKKLNLISWPVLMWYFWWADMLRSCDNRGHNICLQLFPSTYWDLKFDRIKVMKHLNSKSEGETSESLPGNPQPCRQLTWEMI